MTAQQPKECYDGTPCIDGKSDACNICYIPLQRGEKISCKLHTICRYCVNDCFNYNPDYKCDFDTRSSPHPAPANPCEENGCTDIENCDEICEHSRIYSPVQVAEKVKAERVRVVRRFHDAAELGVRELLDALDYEEQTLLGG